MKKFTSSLIVLSVFICFPFYLSAQNFKAELEDPNYFTDYKSGNIVIKGGRDIKRVEISNFDSFTDEFIRTKIVEFGIQDLNNIRTDSITFFAPNGNVSHVGRLQIRGNNNNREIEIIKSDNEGGSSTISTKERITMEYLNDTLMLTKKVTETLVDEGLGISQIETRNYDLNKNRTSITKAYYDPYSGTEISSEGDSIKIEYGESNEVLRQFYLNYESFDNKWKAFEGRELTYNDNVLSNVTISALNDDGSFKELKSKIDQILGMNESYKPFKWEKAASYYVSNWNSDKWEPYEYIQNINNGQKAIITQRWSDNAYINWTRIVKANFQRDLYLLSKYHIDDQLNLISYFRDYSESFGTEAAWSEFFKTRVLVTPGVIESNALVGEKSGYSINETDSTLTLIKQTYDFGTGEWINNLKQVYIFTNVSTVSNNIGLVNKISIYPNPSNGLVNIGLNSIRGLSQIEIINSVGQTLASEKFDNITGDYTYQKDLSHLDRGIYFIRIYSGKNVSSQKFILH